MTGFAPRSGPDPLRRAAAPFPRLSEPGRPGPPPGAAPGAGTSSGTAAPRGRILIVEDDYFVGLSHELALVDAGHEVLGVVASGEEALAWAGRDRPDLVVMDIRLDGEMDGIEVALALRESGIPSLFASAHTDPGTRLRGAAARPLGWIGKPFAEGELAAAVAAALARLGPNGTEA